MRNNPLQDAAALAALESRNRAIRAMEKRAAFDISNAFSYPWYYYSLGGAGIGGLLGLGSELFLPAKRRRLLRGLLTGALLGGISGAGLRGLLGPELWSKLSAPTPEKRLEQAAPAAASIVQDLINNGWIQNATQEQKAQLTTDIAAILATGPANKDQIRDLLKTSLIVGHVDDQTLDKITDTIWGVMANPGHQVISPAHAPTFMEDATQVAASHPLAVGGGLLGAIRHWLSTPRAVAGEAELPKRLFDIDRGFFKELPTRRYRFPLPGEMPSGILGRLRDLVLPRAHSTQGLWQQFINHARAQPEGSPLREFAEQFYRLPPEDRGRMIRALGEPLAKLQEPGVSREFQTESALPKGVTQAAKDLQQELLTNLTNAQHEALAANAGLQQTPGSSQGPMPGELEQILDQQLKRTRDAAAAGPLASMEWPSPETLARLKQRLMNEARAGDAGLIDTGKARQIIEKELSPQVHIDPATIRREFNTYMAKRLPPRPKGRMRGLARGGLSVLGGMGLGLAAEEAANWLTGRYQ